MDFSQLQRKLIEAARTTPPDDRVPLAFEKRIMAHLAGQAAVDPWGLWGRALSRAAVGCVAVMFLLTIISFTLPTAPAGNQESLSQDVEQTVLASVVNNNADQDTW
jgi:hypothetical protein